MAACRTPCEEVRPARARSRSVASPSTLTKTRAWRRSGLVSTAVTVTNPMRGSLSPSASRAERTSRTASLTRRMRSAGILAVQQLFARHQGSFHANSVGKHRLHITLEVGRRIGERSRPRPNKRGGDGRALPQVVMIRLGNGGAEALLQLRLERLKLFALALQAAVLREVQVDFEQTNEAHRR